MAQRTVAQCDGKLIGIETIFTIVDGRQINIPDKLKELRAKSRNNELFCPCGCGANLILVAGDKNLREQHFRIKEADSFQDCHMITEGRTSVDSKIVLKCWLDDNFHADDLETRVSVSAISDSTRKYEFSFLSRSYKIALNYCYDRVNLSDEKLQILEENANGISIIHVVDVLNGSCKGQYPEGLMKIQNRQGYCLLLTVKESDYDKANLKAVFYGKNIDRVWQEITIADGFLKEFRVSLDGSIVFKGKNLTELLGLAKKRFSEGLGAERKKREEAEKQRAEYLLRQQQLEVERRKEEQKKRQEKTEKHCSEKAEKQRCDEEDFKRIVERLNQQEEPVRDSDGNRWIICEYCGKIAKESEFSFYGGSEHLNLGTCKECANCNQAVILSCNVTLSEKTKKAYDSTICPECGKELVKRNGRNGSFIGCSGFPKCRYSRSIK